LSPQQLEEYRSRKRDIRELNSNLSSLRIIEAHSPKIDGQKAVARFQIYSANFQAGRAEGRGPGIFDFDSRKYWPLKGDFSGRIYDGMNETLDSQLVDFICTAINRAVEKSVSPKDTIASIPRPTGFDIDQQLLQVLVEFPYVAMKLKAMAAHAILYVRGYADSQERSWKDPLYFPFPPPDIHVHRNAGSDPLTDEIKLEFQAAESPCTIGEKVGNQTMYANPDLPNLRAVTTKRILEALMTSCPGRESSPIPVEILDGWVYSNRSVEDRKVRLFLVIILKST